MVSLKEIQNFIVKNKSDLFGLINPSTTNATAELLWKYVKECLEDHGWRQFNYIKIVMMFIKNCTFNIRIIILGDCKLCRTDTLLLDTISKYALACMLKHCRLADFNIINSRSV